MKTKILIQKKKKKKKKPHFKPTCLYIVRYAQFNVKL